MRIKKESGIPNWEILENRQKETAVCLENHNFSGFIFFRKMEFLWFSIYFIFALLLSILHRRSRTRDFFTQIQKWLFHRNFYVLHVLPKSFFTIFQKSFFLLFVDKKNSTAAKANNKSKDLDSKIFVILGLNFSKNF